jgi:3-oxoacyl-[acyl-carrier-protein] synthase II
MRRVVVTGLGMVTPLACGVEPTWQRLINGDSGARRIETFDVSDLPAKIACQVPRGDGANGSFNPDHWMEPKEQRKVDDFIIFAMCAARQALGHRRSYRHCRHGDHAQGKRAAAGVAVLHFRPPDQPRVRIRVDCARPEGAQPRGRHRMLDRSARHRRCRATRRAR